LKKSNIQINENSQVFEEDRAKHSPSLIESIKIKKDREKLSSESRFQKINSSNNRKRKSKKVSETISEIINVKESIANLFKTNKNIDRQDFDTSKGFPNTKSDCNKILQDFLDNPEDNADVKMFKLALGIYLHCPKNQMDSYFESLSEKTKLQWIATMCNIMQGHIVTHLNFLKKYMEDISSYITKNTVESCFQDGFDQPITVGVKNTIESANKKSQLDSRKSSTVFDDIINEQINRLKLRKESLGNTDNNESFIKREAISTARETRQYLTPIKTFHNEKSKILNDSILDNLRPLKVG